MDGERTGGSMNEAYREWTHARMMREAAELLSVAIVRQQDAAKWAGFARDYLDHPSGRANVTTAIAEAGMEPTVGGWYPPGARMVQTQRSAHEAHLGFLATMDEYRSLERELAAL